MTGITSPGPVADMPETILSGGMSFQNITRVLLLLCLLWIALYADVTTSASIRLTTLPVVARLSHYENENYVSEIPASPRPRQAADLSPSTPPAKSLPLKSSTLKHVPNSLTTVSTTTLPSTTRPATMKMTTTTTTTTTTIMTTTTTSKKNQHSTKSKTASTRRIYTTNALHGFKRDRPSLYPPGFGDASAGNHTVLDIGANNGDDYTLHAALSGHTVLSFEPSATLCNLFKGVMRVHKVPLSVVHIPPFNTSQEQSSLEKYSRKQDHWAQSVRVVIPRDSAKHPRVYLIPFALSDLNGEVDFYEAKCLQTDKCGKVNRLPRGGDVGANTRVQRYRLDDLVLPVDPSSIWFVKIDVEGHELQVLKGAHKLLRKGNIEYIAIEFSPNGRRGTKWGIDLLEELYSLGYSCYHLRGFGKCHNDIVRSPSMRCNYPFSTLNLSKAPTFKQYTKVFETNDKNAKSKPHMSDLMCKKRGRI